MSSYHDEPISEPPIIPMLVALGRYRLSAYVLMSIALIFLSYLFNLIPGLVIRKVFDSLTAQALAGFNPTTALMLLMLITVVMQVANRSIRSLRQANQAATGAVTGVLGEIFAAVQAIKVSGAERQIVQHFEVINEARRKASLRDLLLFQSISSFAQNAANIAIGLLLLAAQIFQDRGTPLTIGDLALFVTYLTSLAGLIGFFSEIMTRYRQNAVSFQRMLDLMPDQPAMALVAHRSIDLDGPLPMLPKAPPRQPLQHLQVEGLSFCYPHSSNRIADIGFSLQHGTLMLITGRIGRGKTTLLRALLGLVHADAGVIRWNS
jgi:ABC-type multidrug transport system fused ATPase/permease subunit